jgi:hypothetical protein
MFLPRALSAVTDAQNALNRLTPVFEADTMQYQDKINPELPEAVKVENASFEWVVGAEAENIKQERKDKAKEKYGAKEKTSMGQRLDMSEPFKIRNLNLTIHRGQLVAIVGPVRSVCNSRVQFTAADVIVSIPGRLGKKQSSSRSESRCIQSALNGGPDTLISPSFLARCNKTLERYLLGGGLATASRTHGSRTLPCVTTYSSADRGTNIATGRRSWTPLFPQTWRCYRTAISLRLESGE